MIFIDGRFFIHHEKWECWKSGLYKKRKSVEEKVFKCRDILQDVNKCDKFFSLVTKEWPNSSKVHLSNRSINRQAWIGHASFCISHGANEDEGILGWHLITKEEQQRANAIADYYITLFEIENKLNAKKIFRNGCSNRCQRTREMDF